jgi:hypothetical protein
VVSLRRRLLGLWGKHLDELKYKRLEGVLRQSQRVQFLITPFIAAVPSRRLLEKPYIFKRFHFACPASVIECHSLQIAVRSLLKQRPRQQSNVVYYGLIVLRNFSMFPRFPGIEDDKLTETVRAYCALYTRGSK